MQLLLLVVHLYQMLSSLLGYRSTWEFGSRNTPKHDYLNKKKINITKLSYPTFLAKFIVCLELTLNILSLPELHPEQDTRQRHCMIILPGHYYIRCCDYNNYLSPDYCNIIQAAMA